MSEPDAYARAGVNIAAGQRATELMKAAVVSTYGPEVLAGIGAFGGLYAADALLTMQAPVLVASIDGVGTKTKVAARLGRWETIGHDLVNHCVNDILVQGARPLFFLDYVASARLDPEQIAAVVGGVAAACRANGCALLGGETAEMPGVYVPGELDLAGAIVGVVDRAQLIDGSAIADGDVLLALPSSGPHTNGYSLLRRLFDPFDWSEAHPELGESIGAALLTPHRSYLAPVQALLRAGAALRGLAHITGGGLIDNLPRILPDGLGAWVQRGRWPEPPIFRLAARLGDLAPAELFHVFNMGVGMVLVVAPGAVSAVQETLAALGEPVYTIGRIVAGRGVHIDV